MPIWDTTKRWVNDLVGGQLQTQKPNLSASDRAPLASSAMDDLQWEDEEKGQGSDADFPARGWAAQDPEQGPDPDRDWSEEERQAIRERRAELRKSTVYQPGQELECTITGIRYYGIFLEMPNGEPALAPKFEAQVRDEDPVAYQIGQTVKVLVMEFVPELGLKVSIARCRNPYRYNRLTIHKTGEVLQGVVSAEVDTGHIVTLDNGEYGLVKKLRYQALGEVPPYDLGDTVRVKLLGFKPDLGWRMSEIAARKRPPLMYHPQPMYIGHIEKIYSSAIIVRMPDQSWGRVPHVEWGDEAYEVGMQVQVCPVKRENDIHWRYSLKEAEMSWEEWASAHPVGTPITGTIKAVADYGVFVRVMPGIDGLLHTHKMYLAPRAWTKHGFEESHIGQKIDAIVDQLSDEPGRRLVLRLVNPLQVGQIVQGKVAAFSSMGMHVKIAPGVHATWSVGAIKFSLGVKPKDAAKVGDTVRLRVKRAGHKIEHNQLEAVAGENHLATEAAPAKAAPP